MHQGGHSVAKAAKAVKKHDFEGKDVKAVNLHILSTIWLQKLHYTFCKTPNIYFFQHIGKNNFT